MDDRKPYAAVERLRAFIDWNAVAADAAAPAFADLDRLAGLLDACKEGLEWAAQKAGCDTEGCPVDDALSKLRAERGEGDRE